MTKDERIVQLEDRVAELEDMLGMSAHVPQALMALTVGVRHRIQVEAIISMLVARPLLTRAAAYDQFYRDRAECDQPGFNVISVYMVHARRALAAAGMRVNRIFDQGWFLDNADRTRLREMIKQSEMHPVYPCNGGPKPRQPSNSSSKNSSSALPSAP